MSSKSQCGPPPRQGRRRNGAEQFKEEQEAEYVARERVERNLCKEVERHNKACPKLCDELRKRKSLSNIRAFSGRGVIGLGSSRRHAQKNKQKRLNYRRKIGESPMSPTKPKKHFDKRSIRLIDNIVNSKLHMKQTQTSTILVNLNSIRRRRKGQDNRRSCFTGCQQQLDRSSSISVKVLRRPDSKFRDSNSNLDEINSDYDLAKPESSEPSVSSYHSFASTNNEPMG